MFVLLLIIIISIYNDKRVPFLFVSDGENGILSKNN